MILIDGHLRPRLAYLNTIEGAALSPADVGRLRAIARRANRTVQLRAQYHRVTKSTAYFPFGGHSAAVDSVDAFHLDRHPSEREVLVTKDGVTKWANPLMVVVEREA